MAKDTHPVRTALIITSIASPNKVLNACLEGCRKHDIDFIVIGDTKSPPDFSLDGCDFWDIERQRDMGFQLAVKIPEKHYARKNLGYLLAMKRGAEVIIETDDDNLPMVSFWGPRAAHHETRCYLDAGWVNVYRFFSDLAVWPRGFPLQYVKTSSPLLPQGNFSSHFCPIQQGLVNGNPDVDAIYRLTHPLPIVFEQAEPVVLSQGSWSPFNSQNTTWFKEAFMLLYLPTTCNFRVTDIWRSFVAQRVCWANGWSVLFHAPTVYQERNCHNLMDNFSDELPSYLHNDVLVHALAQLDLSPGAGNIAESLVRCYRQMLSLGLIQDLEMELLKAWIDDVTAMGLG